MGSGDGQVPPEPTNPNDLGGKEAPPEPAAAKSNPPREEPGSPEVNSHSSTGAGLEAFGLNDPRSTIPGGDGAKDDGSAAGSSVVPGQRSRQLRTLRTGPLPG